MKARGRSSAGFANIGGMPPPGRRPTVCVLYNPKAGSAESIAAVRDAISGRAGVCLVEAADGDDLKRQAAEAVRGGCELLAVAGGDGTVHAVVNALGPDFP